MHKGSSIRQEMTAGFVLLKHTLIFLKILLLLLVALITPSSGFLSSSGLVPHLYPTNSNPCFVCCLAYKIGISNIPGVDFQRPQKVNQDAWFHSSSNLKDDDDDDDDDDGFFCIGVLDGHGLLGHQLSKYFADCLPRVIGEQLLLAQQQPNDYHHHVDLETRIEQLGGLKPKRYTKNIYHQALVNAFHSVHWNAMSDPEIKTGRNGSTAIVCILDYDQDQLHVAFVGDSRAISVARDNNNNNNNNTTTISLLATETTVRNMPKEKQRIENQEGDIRGENVFYGPVGIAMTRALGDAVMLRAGVVPTPLVETFPMHKGDDTTVILATDGVWGVLTNEQVATIAKQFYGDPEKTARAISEKAKERWVGDLPIKDEVKMDDITTLVLYWDS